MLMNIITLSLLLMGMVFIIVGYTDMFYNTKETEKTVEYRFIPQKLYDQIYTEDDLTDQFNFMFDATNVTAKTNLL